MAPTTQSGLLVLVLTLPLLSGGAWLVRNAQGRQPPVVAPHRTLPASVLEVQATPCRSRRSPGTCFRTVATYTDGGRTLQVASRSRYRPARHRKGEALSVVVEDDGTAWIDVEWREHQTRRLREHEDARGFPLMMGWLLVGSGGFGVLLGLGLIFWVDRST